MDDKRPQDELSEQIDAVRPASDDLAQPDFMRLAEHSRRNADVRAVLQRSQRLDLAISDALQDLPVPAGAVERLLNTLSSAAAATDTQATTPDASASGVREAWDSSELSRSSATSAPPTRENDPPDLQSRQAALKQRRASDDESRAGDPSQESEEPHRRRTRFGMGALAAAVVVALAAWWVFLPGAGEFGPDEALHILNSDWLFNVDEAALAQTPIDDRLPPARYPLAQAVSVPATAWRRITDFLGRPGVAYQLRTPAARATLYVVDVEAALDAPQVVDLPAAPNVPPLTTAGKAMSIWREGKLMYVLVVSGGEAEFKSFVTRGGQLARASSASGRAVSFE